MSEENPYSYFDTPDGQDVDKKLKCFMKPTLQYTLGIALGDIVLYSKPKGYLSTVGRVAYISSPILAAGGTFVLATNTAAAIRKKDDKLNWFMGGFASGTIFGAWRRSGMLGFNLGMALGLIAFLKKMAVENNYTIFPELKVKFHEVHVQDWTLTKDRPRNWVTHE